MELNTTDNKLIHVLLVEDEYLISEWVAQSLSEQGFAVQTATNAADALGHLTSDQVDVLFTDINLPGDMDGAALRAPRARDSAEPSRRLCLGAGDNAGAGGAGSRRDHGAEAL